MCSCFHGLLCRAFHRYSVRTSRCPSPKDYTTNSGSQSIDLGCVTPHEASKALLENLDVLRLQVKSSAITDTLRWCGDTKALGNGKRVHDCIVQAGLERDMFVGGCLLQMYGKCGALEDSLVLFDNMPQHHLFLWSYLIREHARQGQSQEALRLFDQMQQEAVLPDKVTFACIFSAFVHPAALAKGKWMHSRIVYGSFESDVAVGNALVSMYGKCGNLADVCRTFDRMPERDVISWTTMIAEYAQQGQGKESLKLFDQMLCEGVVPNNVTFISILSACVSQETLAIGQQIQARLVNTGFESDVNLGNALMNMYGKCGGVKHTRMTFDQMPERDVVSWNAIIAVHARCGQKMEAFQLLDQMGQKRVTPNKVTFVSILSACTSLSQVMQTHVCIINKGFEFNTVVGTALLSMYGKCGSPEDALANFYKMPERNLISWNAMIAVYAQHGKHKRALKLFNQMMQQGVMPNKVTYISILAVCGTQGGLGEGEYMHTRILACGYDSDTAVGNAIVNMYGKCGNIEDARREFDNLLIRDVISWTVMITVYAQHGQGKEARQIFEQMQREGIIPDKVAYISILDACASQAALAEGEGIHLCLIKQGLLSDVAVATALINMYGKCGNIDAARRVFDKMPERNIVSWTTMIAAHAHHGQGREALQLFDQMKKEVSPDKITFLSVLAACSHSGLVEEGHQFLTSMNEEHCTPPIVDHYGCMIDLLGRAGLLDEAEDLIDDMPFEPTAVSFMALLGACRYQDDVKRAERAAKRVFELDPTSPSPYVMLSKIYVAAGRVDDATELLRRMEEKGVRGYQGAELPLGCNLLPRSITLQSEANSPCT